MTAPAVPTKTPLGQEELRARTQGLGQRYRTVLLLVDGRRTLGDRGPRRSCVGDLHGLRRLNLRGRRSRVQPCVDTVQAVRTRADGRAGAGLLQLRQCMRECELRGADERERECAAHQR